MVFLLAYQCGWGPLAMLVMLELFPASQRGAAGGATVAVNWGVTFLVTQTFQPLVNTLGENGELVVFIGHAALTLFATVYMHRHLPETNPLFIGQSSVAPSASAPIPATHITMLHRV